MAMTIQEVERHLQAEGLKYQRIRDAAVGLVFGDLRRYRNPEGEPRLLVVVSLEENGEYLKVFAPQAFTAQGPHVDDFLRACAMIQWATKLIQFEYDPSDGEIRPIVEFPIEDGTVTQKQLARCVHAVVGLLEEYYPALQQALETGKVALPGREEALAGMLRQLLGQLPPDQLARLLEDLESRGRGQGGSGGGSTTDDPGGPREL